MLEKTEWEINNEQSRETSNIGDNRYKTEDKTKNNRKEAQHNMLWTLLYANNNK